VGRFEREIQADHGPAETLLEHLEKQAAAATDVQNGSDFLGFMNGALDKVELVAEDEAAVGLLQAVGGGAFGDEPIIARVVIAELGRSGLGMEADETALTALNDLENFGSGAIQPVRGGEQDADGGRAAGGTRGGA
jgi:hypothetical protein